MKKTDSKYTWNLLSLYKSEDDPQIEKDILSDSQKANQFIIKWRDNNSYLTNPDKLYEALEEYENFTEGGIFNKPLYYFWLRINLDQTDKKLRAKEKLISNKAIEYVNKLQFFELNIGKIEKSLQKKLLKYPKLSKYKHNLERSFELAKYNLSEKEETIINLLVPNGTNNWSDMLEEFLSKETVKINGKDKTFEELISDTQSQNKKIRDTAGMKIDTILKKWVDIAEHEINSNLDVKRKVSELRNINEPDKTSHLSDDIDSEIVHAMIDRVTRSFNISKRYYKLLTRLINKNKIGYHERGLEYGEIKNSFSYERSIELVISTYKNLDLELGRMVEGMFEEGRVDAFPKKGKSGGAFCVHSGSKVPVYVLLNHTGTLNKTLTIAHELGHAVNNLLMIKNQPPNNVGTPKSTAEVASTFFEDFVLDEILKTATEEERFNIMVGRLRDDVSTIFRQVACYNFELDLHNSIKEKGYVPQEGIGNLFKKNMTAYLGPSVNFTKEHENWWVYWGHIRRPFYVYSYASGVLISKSLQSMVRKDPKNIQKVKRFLSAGISKSPKEIFKDLDIDITDNSFWEKGLKEIEKLLNGTEQLAKKLGKI